MQQQQAYWDRVADAMTFTHPLNRDWLDRFVDKKARVLDYGCGYGRALHALAGLGYTNAIGVDFSARMIERARREAPQMTFALVDDFPFAESAGTFDAILLMAVLTCVAGDQAQVDLIARLHGLLRPGGLLYLSDMPLQTDERNLARYAEGARRFGDYGVFQTEDGAIMRHHDDRRLADLLGAFERVAYRTVSIRTLNGHAATAVQLLMRRPLF